LSTKESGTVEPHDLLRLIGLISHRMRGRGGVPPALQAAFGTGTLGPRHMPILFSLARRPAASITELAERFGLAPATVSLLVNDLDRAKLVERREDEADRRRTVVTVPDEHRVLLSRLADERLGLMRRTLARLSPAARVHFAEGLRVLAEESEAIEDDAADCAPAAGRGR
jgi:DNA-binding MarR family transcriptional regulator